ncbi:hypothetical protein FOS14_10250 [Skermania sp. ID1734]|nr:hypothetical protein FOS14_10250 [Skermania sp. ID1734]
MTVNNAAAAARAVVAGTNVATLASLTDSGGPWASFIAYGQVGGAPVLCVSQLAEHGRNLARDPRASLSIVSTESVDDPLARSRVTLAGVVRTPLDVEVARQSYLAAAPSAATFIDFPDFTLWQLEIQRVRWVGGYGRMESVRTDAYLDGWLDA